jgi:hypothetical protein
MRTDSRIPRSRIVAVILIGAAFSFGALYLQTSRAAATGGAEARPTPRKRPVGQKPKYTEFPHNEKAHQVECGTCHTFPSDNWNKVRPADKAFPDVTEYPKHPSCVGCHKQQFFRGAPPKICSICHVSSFPPRDSTRHPYPNPREIYDLSPKGKARESHFVVGFPHDKHIEIVSADRADRGSFINASFESGVRRRAGEDSCKVCHQTYKPQGDSKEEYVTPPPAKLGDGFWLKKGTFKSAPIGHTTCFTCHNTDMGIAPAPSNCAACHHLKPDQPTQDFDAGLATGMGITDKIMLYSWRRRESAGKFQHDFFAHADSSCSTCHNVLTMNTADPLTRKVSITACATCHVTSTVDEGGAVNFEIGKRADDAKFQCIKCHIVFGKLPVPKSHADAVAAAKGK